MEALESIKIYQNLVYVSIAVAVIGLGLSVFFFFYFNIPGVFQLMTGRGKKDKLKKISEENFKTGRIRFHSVTGPTTGPKNNKGHTGSIAAIHIQSESGAVKQQIEEAPLEETSVLETPVEQTTMLHKEEQTVPIESVTVPQSSTSFCVVEQTMLIHTDEQVC